MPFLNVFHNIRGIFAEKLYQEKIFRLKSTEYYYLVTFLKMYRFRYRCYFFSKVSVPISSLLLKYRVPTSDLRKLIIKINNSNNEYQTNLL